jgi:hypothetical protein
VNSLSEPTKKWRTATLVTGVCVLLGAAMLIIFAIYGATQRAATSGEAAVNAIEILLVLFAGAAAVLAWRYVSKLTVSVSLGLFALLTLLTLIVFIIIVAGPSKQVAEMLVDETCKLKNLAPQQCDTIKQFSTISIFVFPVVTFLYCACYLGVSAMYFRAMRNEYGANARRATGTSLAESDADGFDDFSNANAPLVTSTDVPVLNVSADVI